MPRGINSATIAELAKDSFNLATLVKLNFSTPLKLTDWGRNVDALSQTWTSSSHMMALDSPVETQELRVNTLNITMSGVEQSLSSIFLSQTAGQSTYLDTTVEVYRACMSDTDTVIGAPILMFQGLITGFDINDSENNSTLTIECASHWKDFEKQNGRRTNTNSQQVHFAGDIGFDWAALTIADLRWGKS